MAETQRTMKLDTKTARMALETGKDHVLRLSDGCYLHYRKPINGGSGTWRARWRNANPGKIISQSFGAADDILPGSLRGHYMNVQCSAC